jgi:hypothetical protein
MPNSQNTSKYCDILRIIRITNKFYSIHPNMANYCEIFAIIEFGKNCQTLQNTGRFSKYLELLGNTGNTSELPIIVQTYQILQNVSEYSQKK